ncbi:hypothetical protein ASD89_06900 [Caulobacter sp. Root656]|nr:hypothetical protein ASD89_06900 [Caulobacter sp. Root656]
MELREFVTNTLVQILEGVGDAQEQLGKTGKRGIVNPTWGGGEKLYEHVQNVSFDVAVTVASKAEGGANAGIKVLAIDIGAKGSIETQNSNVSRVAFSIPILPTYTAVTDVQKP